MSTYQSVLDITPEIAPSLTKDEVSKVVHAEINAIDDRFKAEGKSAGLGKTAKNALASGAKEVAEGAKNMGLGCLNMLLPFAALGFFMRGKKKTAITQVVLCSLALIVPMCAGSVVGGVVACYVVGILYIAALALWGKIMDAKQQFSDAKNALSNFNNPYFHWKSLTSPEHFTAPEHYNEYIALLDEREAHYLQIIKLCK